MFNIAVYVAIEEPICYSSNLKLIMKVAKLPENSFCFRGKKGGKQITSERERKLKIA